MSGKMGKTVNNFRRCTLVTIGMGDNDEDEKGVVDVSNRTIDWVSIPIPVSIARRKGNETSPCNWQLPSRRARQEGVRFPTFHSS